MNISQYVCVLLFSFTFVYIPDGTLCLKLLLPFISYPLTHWCVAIILIIRQKCDLAELRGWTPLPPIFPICCLVSEYVSVFGLLYDLLLHLLLFVLFGTHGDSQSMSLRLFWMVAVLTLCSFVGMVLRGEERPPVWLFLLQRELPVVAGPAGQPVTFSF